MEQLASKVPGDILEATHVAWVSQNSHRTSRRPWMWQVCTTLSTTHKQVEAWRGRLVTQSKAHPAPQEQSWGSPWLRAGRYRPCKNTNSNRQHQAETTAGQENTPVPYGHAGACEVREKGRFLKPLGQGAALVQGPPKLHLVVPDLGLCRSQVGTTQGRTPRTWPTCGRGHQLP